MVRTVSTANIAPEKNTTFLKNNNKQIRNKRQLNIGLATEGHGFIYSHTEIRIIFFRFFTQSLFKMSDS